MIPSMLSSAAAPWANFCCCLRGASPRPLLQERGPVGNVQYEEREGEKEAGKLVDAEGRFPPVAERIVPRYLRRAVVLVVAVLVKVDRLRQILVRVALHRFGRHRAHVVVDHRELHQRQKHKHGAGRHPDVDGLHVRYRR